MDPLNTQNSSGMMNGMPLQPKQEKKVGPIVGALIIILILILAALYFFGQKFSSTSPAESVSPSTPVVQEQNGAAAITAADDVDTLQAELSAELKDVDYSF